MLETTPILPLRLLADHWFLVRPEGDHTLLGLPEADANAMLAEAKRLARDGEMVVVRYPNPPP